MSPLGAVCPLPQDYIHVLNYEKNCIKSDFKEISLKLATNGWSDKPFLLTSKVCPLGAVCPCYIHALNHEKNCIKSDFRDIFWNMQQMNEETRHFCGLWTSKLCPLGTVCPCPGAVYMYKIMKKLYKIRLQRDFFKLVTNDRSDKMFLLTSKFHPQGVVSPCAGAIYMYKIMKTILRVFF